MRSLLVLAVLAAACSGQSTAESEWTELAGMETPRSEHPGVTLHGDVVVIGGLVETAPGRTGVTATVEAYDPGADAWRSLPDLPQPRHHVMASVVDERLFVIGGFSESGFDPVDTVWELVDAGWEVRAPLPTPVGAGAAVTLDGLIYVIGGTPPASGMLRYHSEDDRWEELTAPRLEREHVAAATLDGEIWAIAGRWQGDFFVSTEIYDPVTDLWREGPALVHARSGFGAATVDDIIVVAGGEVFGPDAALSSVEYLQDGRWVEGEPLPIGLHGNPLVALDGRLYLPGGSTRAGGVDNPGKLFSHDPVP